MKEYDHNEIEKKWQERWAASGIYEARENTGRPKKYVLDMFPYPSGEGLHVGHPKGYIATDAYSRMMRMKGFEVLHPMGWDAFGLPAENYAIKNKVHPRAAVEKNVATFKSQLAKIGFNYDWTREINTTDPEFYKWTQWIFLKLYEKGLAYQSFEPINWCPSCQTGLANEDLEGNACERCGTIVERRPMRQWVLKITQYADRLLEDLELLPEWQSHIKESQRNWIGRSEGAHITFKTTSGDDLKVFTTRPDTLFGATYMVVAPEHPLVEKVCASQTCTTAPEIMAYINAAKNKSDLERQAGAKDKTGVELTGIKAINPANGEEIPIYVADYVLAGYGTGAIMAVPVHDERDFAFAQKFNIPVRQVIVPCAPDSLNPPKPGLEDVKRDTVIVHLKDKATGRFAVLDWHGSLEGITTAIMGGVENGQTPQEAALAEIREEASIESAVIVKEGRWITAAKYCASHKNQNRTAHAWVFLAEVENLSAQNAISPDEQKLHTLVWIDEKDVAARLTPEHQKLMWRMLHSDEPLTGSGYLMNSGEFDGMDSEAAKKAITEKIGGEMATTYRIQDWVFSRQRYWGEPIPMIHCEKCGVVPVPEQDLPVTLPEVEHYEPTGTGESPLAAIESWVNTTCPKCGGAAKRETNTMPQWAGSSWYYLRYMDPKNTDALVSRDKEKYWAPVDLYVGGAEHATRHLIYARFWHKFLFDEGYVSTPEPFMRLISVGLIQAEDGRKMSKRYGNVINPDDIVATYGADTLRVYEMFMGPFTDAIAWKTASLIGARRFIERTWRLQGNITDAQDDATERLLHRTIKKVGEDIEHFKFNTAISQMMIFVNAAEKTGVTKSQFERLLQILAPFAPHIADELWNTLGATKSIHVSSWPSYEEAMLKEDEVMIAIQISGKARGVFAMPSGADQAAVEAKAREIAAKHVEGKETVRVVFVPDRLINIVVK